MKTILVHFSGGSDSTYCASWAAENYDHVYLISYDRLSFIGTEKYTEINYKRLCAIYGKSKFTRKIANIEKLHKKICFDRYLKTIFRFGLATTSLVFSKLAMHMASSLICLKHGISAVADGAVPYMHLYPDQNQSIAKDALTAFYQKIGVEYLNPAYDCASSVEQKLYDRGIIETREVRGTQDDKQVFYAEQVLLALFLKYYLTRYSQEKYESVLKELYSDRIDLMQGWLSEFQSHKTIKGLEKWTFQV